jgi:acetyl-CoA carboxylase biotin carboxylase subunit
MAARRILVANRGEIAVRIIRACHAAGAEAVAVYSDADRDAQWVHVADRAVHIGRSQAAKSYLNAEALLAAATSSGADAVHPGYGFLSERAGFARAVADAGLIFVGPDAEVIERMGDKAAARRAAKDAGVPVVPGSEPVADVTAATAAADEIGYPLLLKASAGGGGRGIRPVTGPAELAERLPAAQGEASAAFGDGSIYLERALSGARHIEVQVLADHYGGIVHAFERDCSVQRRRQKLLEEAPAPALGERLREEITAAAVRLAKQTGYRGAGTVEFLVTEDGQFYFIEMNTRIQVEHPITEAVTGLDLVAEQLRIADGAPLSVAQEDIVCLGAAVEFRINAEDPDNSFQPTPGPLTEFTLPPGAGVRMDTGFVEGDRISPYYDSLIAKLICWGADRDEAFHRAGKALRELRISGVPSTASLHRRLVEDPKLQGGPVHTGWLEQWLLNDPSP